MVVPVLSGMEWDQLSDSCLVRVESGGMLSESDGTVEGRPESHSFCSLSLANDSKRNHNPLRDSRRNVN